MNLPLPSHEELREADKKITLYLATNVEKVDDVLQATMKTIPCQYITTTNKLCVDFLTNEEFELKSCPRCMLIVSLGRAREEIYTIKKMWDDRKAERESMNYQLPDPGAN